MINWTNNKFKILLQIYLLKKKNKNLIKYVLHNCRKLYYKYWNWVNLHAEINRKSRMAIFDIKLRFQKKSFIKLYTLEVKILLMKLLFYNSYIFLYNYSISTKKCGRNKFSKTNRVLFDIETAKILFQQQQKNEQQRKWSTFWYANNIPYIFHEKDARNAFWPSHRDRNRIHRLVIQTLSPQKLPISRETGEDTTKGKGECELWSWELGQRRRSFVSRVVWGPKEGFAKTVFDRARLSRGSSPVWIELKYGRNDESLRTVCLPRLLYIQLHRKRPSAVHLAPILLKSLLRFWGVRRGWVRLWLAIKSLFDVSPRWNCVLSSILNVKALKYVGWWMKFWLAGLVGSGVLEDTDV